VIGEYNSVFGGRGTIKLEVGQKEKPERPLQAALLSTLLLDPLFSEDAVGRFEVTALDKTVSVLNPSPLRWPVWGV
jgi:hypothetical protein